MEAILNDTDISVFLKNKLPSDFYLHGDGLTKSAPLALGFDYQTVRMIIPIIPRLFQQHKHTNKKYYNTSSYGGKNLLENYIKKSYEMNFYVSNGEFILAMLLLDYEYKISGVPNMSFNASSRNLNKKTCACGLDVTIFSEAQHLKTNLHNKLMQHILINTHLNDDDSEYQDFLEDAISRLL